MSAEQVAREVVDAVYKQPLEERTEFLTSVLLELSTTFPGTMFVDAVEGMNKVWDEQAAQNT